MVLKEYREGRGKKENMNHKTHDGPNLLNVKVEGIGNTWIKVLFRTIWGGLENNRQYPLP